MNVYDYSFRTWVVTHVSATLVGRTDSLSIARC